MDLYSHNELAYAFEETFAKGVAQLAINSAKRSKIDISGLTGGGSVQ